MFKYKQHNSDNAPKASVDGFRATSSVSARSSSKDGFSNRNNQTTRSIAQPSPKAQTVTKAKPRFIKDDDLNSFPGLAGSYTRPATSFELDSLPEVPKKRNRRKKISIFKVLKRTAMASTLVVMLIGGFLVYKGVSTARDVFKGTSEGALALNQNIDPALLTSEGDGRINVLILGKGGDSHDGGELTDSITVASIDPFSKKATLLSVPRDLYVSVPGFWSMKINAAYATSKFKALDEGNSEEDAETIGAATIENTIEEYMGIPIHYYAMLDFFAFEDAVDAVGGVEVDVANRLYDSNFRPALDVPAGVNNFDGPTALFYVRSRYTSPRGDFDRAQRQREVLIALKDKIVSAGTFANPLRISGLLDSISDNARTSMSVDEVIAIYDIIKDIQPADISSVSFVDEEVLVATSFVGDQSVVIPRAGINDFSDIKEYVRSTMRDGFLAKENATVVVLNGSGKTGGATAMTNVLESYGYNVTKTADASRKDYLSTVLIDNTDEDKPYTGSYLEKRLGVVAKDGSKEQGLQVYDADYIVIIGANEKNI